MRPIVMIAFVVAACGGGQGDDEGDGCIFMGVHHELGEEFPAGDGCNACKCLPEGPTCTLKACLDAGVDAGPGFCGATGACSEGPECGASCCGRGEQCQNNSCVCGSNAACGPGDTCEAAGPLGGDLCGSICCGASGPCPQ